MKLTATRYMRNGSVAQRNVESLQNTNFIMDAVKGMIASLLPGQRIEITLDDL